MHQTILNLNAIKNEIKTNNKINERIKIIAVSKNFSINYIKPLIDFGHIHFGENRVQESIEKWPDIKEKNKNLKLHFIGKLQTNKVKYILPLFDYIHSLDNLKLAEKIDKLQNRINFRPKIFIQVNIGEEQQKNGVLIKDLENFIKDCKENFDLDIIGLMCIPPNDNEPEKYFKELNRLNKKFNFTDLSMGMSSDYLNAIKYGSTFVRIGSKIFGNRV
jgi:pyridoxal phosphate enzyme (YggS family)